MPIKFTFNDETYTMQPRERLFCMCYVKNKLNGKQAAIDAGYSEKTAKVTASRLLTKANLIPYIEALKEDIAFCLGVTAVDIAREYHRIGFSDIRKIFDENGNVIDPKDFGDEAAANVSGIEVFEEYAGKGEDREYIGRTKTVKFYNKVAALDNLARMLGKDGAKKIATVDSKGKDVKPGPAVQVIHIDPNTLTDEQLEKIIANNEAAFKK